MRTLLIAASMIVLAQIVSNAQPLTYCNPINLDYGYTPIPNFSEMGRHRATADPVITVFKGKYYLFSTNQWGYWWSDNMYNWNFVSRRFLKPWHNVYGTNEHYFTAMDVDKTYYFQIESFNEAGIGKRGEVIKVE